jgi:NADPH-dependent 2,4-dienoyl-CoA reductase/sulfur reductase-like enzyme
MTRRYLIAGSGAAGLAAAETIRQQDASASVTIVTEDRYRYYSRPGLAYWLSGEVTGEQLFPFKPDYYQQIGLQVRAGRVARLQPAEHRAVLSSGESIVYDRLLIATGASANRLELPGSQAPGVVKLDNMDDAGEILKRARRGKTAVVVGGGITALELAEGLCARGMRVHYLLRGDRYWSAVLDEVESRIVEQRLKDDGITIHYNAQLVSLVVGRGGELAGVCIRAGERDV